MMQSDNRQSTAGYLPTTIDKLSGTGYVPCQEKYMYPALDSPDYPGTSAAPDDITVIATKDGYDDRSQVELVKEQGKQDKPNDYVELTIVACIFNFLFGLVAMGLAFKSQENWKNGYRTKAKWYGIVSMAMSVFAIITTAIIIFVVIWLFLFRETYNM